MNFVGTILRFIVERRAARKSLDKIKSDLKNSASQVGGRFERAADTPANQHEANHIIGIEVWGQHRLRSLFSEPLVMDEYDIYCPGDHLPMSSLGRCFQETRNVTLDLVEELKQVNIEGIKIPHNEIGELSVSGWLVYLNSHAQLESRKLKKA
jgi:hypothetical protein